MPRARGEGSSSTALGWVRSAPALTLMLMAPLTAEVLPGATRFSSLFVVPIEICGWGGGAIMIRYAVRRWRLGRLNMLSLALAPAIAEECPIQQHGSIPEKWRLLLGFDSISPPWASARGPRRPCTVGWAA